MGIRTKAEAYIYLIDRYTELAVKLSKAHEPDLSRFYKHVAEGLSMRLDCLTLEECGQVLA